MGPIGVGGKIGVIGVGMGDGDGDGVGVGGGTGDGCIFSSSLATSRSIISLSRRNSPHTLLFSSTTSRSPLDCRLRLFPYINPLNHFRSLRLAYSGVDPINQVTCSVQGGVVKLP